MKLYSVSLEESGSDSSNDLLIDKILKQSEEPEEPMAITADILKQKKELQAKVEEEFKKSTEESTSDDSEEEEEPDDTDDETTEDEEGDDKDSDKEDEEDDKEDDGDDDDDIDSMMGSELNDDDPKEDKDDKKDEKEEVSEEGFFEDIKRTHKLYLDNLRKFSLESHAIEEDKQPIVYVKESVIKALNNILKATEGYVENNSTFIRTASEATKKINERLIIFKKFVEEEQYEFTEILIDDKDILKTMSVPGKNKPREMSNLLIKYKNNIDSAVMNLVKNRFDLISDSFENNEFDKADDDVTTKTIDLTYNKMLPGFNQISVTLGQYKNYLEVKVADYSFYKTEVMRTEDLYNLPSVSINDERDIEYLIENLGTLLVGAAGSADSVSNVIGEFSKLVEKVKGLIYDVNEDKFENLAQVGIDGIVKDFIKFKLAIEAYYITYNVLIDYITGLMSLVNASVQLTEEGSSDEPKDE